LASRVSFILGIDEATVSVFALWKLLFFFFSPFFLLRADFPFGGPTRGGAGFVPPPFSRFRFLFDVLLG
jgi:hypothetical protein